MNDQGTLGTDLQVAEEVEAAPVRIEARRLVPGMEFKAGGKWNTVRNVQPGFYGQWGPCYVQTTEMDAPPRVLTMPDGRIEAHQSFKTFAFDVKTLVWARHGVG